MPKLIVWGGMAALAVVLVFVVVRRGASMQETSPVAPLAAAGGGAAETAPVAAPAPARAENGGAAGAEPSAPPSPASQARPVTEADLMRRLRAIKDKDPAAAVVLARQGNDRYPDSAAAPERASILVHALAALGQASQARGEAEGMVNHFPDSEWVREVERFSGAHRHRNVHVTDAGVIEYR